MSSWPACVGGNALNGQSVYEESRTRVVPPGDFLFYEFHGICIVESGKRQWLCSAEYFELGHRTARKDTVPAGAVDLSVQSQARGSTEAGEKHS